MLKKLHILVLKSYLGPFIMTFFIAMFILLMQFLWKYIDDLVGKGLGWYIITQLMFYASSTFVPLALPLAVLLSSLMTFGNFGERYELVAMKSAGISLRQIMKPLAFTAIIISIAAFYFSDLVLPVANLKMRALLYDVREQKPTVNIKEGVFYNGIDNYVIRVGSKDKDGITLRDIMIYDHTDRMGDVNLTLSEWGKMEFTSDKRFLLFYLYNGVNYYEDLSSGKKTVTRPLQRTTFKEQYVRIDLSEFSMTRTSEDLFKGNYRMLNLHQLNIVVDSLNRNMNKSRDMFVIKFGKDNLYFYETLVNNYNVSKNSSGKSELKSPYIVQTIKLPENIVKEPKPANSNYQLSTINYQPKPIKPNIIDNFEKKQKAGIIEIAIEMTRRAKENIFFQSEDIKSRQKLIYKHKIEFFRKFTLSLACLIFFLIGAPLGAIIRRGGFGLPVIVSVLFFVVYHVISVVGEKFAREGVVPVFVGMWLSTIVILPLGTVLAYKATTDSPILDAELWTRFFKKIYLIRNKKKKENETELI